MNIELDNKNKIKLAVLCVLIFILLLGGVSYAYFGINIIGNEDASSNSVTTLTNALGYLKYTDAEIVTDDMVLPGWTESKTVTVENIGSTTVYYKVIWRKLLNQFISDEIKMSITCSSSSGTCPDLSETSISTNLSEITDQIIIDNIEIESGVTHTYTITFSWIETGSNQSYNKNKRMKGLINIEEGTQPVRPVATGESYESMPIVTIGEEEFYDITNAVDYSSLDASFKELIDYDASKSILLARYNLSPTTGLQTTSTTRSDYSVPFSGSSNANGYWYDSGLKLQYGPTLWKSNIYDKNYITAPNYSVAFSNNIGNANYSVAYYVENYVSSLGVNAEGRLLTDPEANIMTQAQRNSGQSYWVGSAISSIGVRCVNASGKLSNDAFDDVEFVGVRPVLIVNTSDIQSS